MKVPQPRKLKSGTWFCQLRLGGESIPVTATTEKECRRQASLIKAEYLNGKKQAKADDITLAEAIDRYIARRSNLFSPATVRGYRIIQKHRFPELMQRKIATITAQDIQAAVNDASKTLSTKTIKNGIGLILPALADCGQHINDDSILYPMQVEREKPIYTEQQQQTLLLAIRGTSVEIPVLLASWLGLRRSEIIALRWKDVDLKAKKLRVHAARVQDQHNQYVDKDVTKTPKSTRTVSLSDYLCDVLRAAMTDDLNAYIVSTSPQTIRNRMVKICEKADIPFYGLHALRHTNASVMLKLGIQNKYAQQRGGWSSDRVLTKTYQHTFASELDHADAVVNQYYEQLVSPKPPQKTKKFRIVRSPDLFKTASKNAN